MTFPKDTMEAKIAFYGDPRGDHGVDQAWFAENVTHVVPPFRMTYAGKPIKAIQFHKKCAPALRAALSDIWDHCGQDQTEVDRYGLSEFGGSFNYRLIRGRPGAISNHSFAIAIDLEPVGNELGKTKGRMPAFAVAAFKRHGFKWGGDYKGRKDWMHFEAVDNGGTAVAEPKPLVKSKIAQASAAVGLVSGGDAISTMSDAADQVSKLKGTADDLGLMDVLTHLAHTPRFWMAIAVVALVGAVTYWRWRDHGGGQEE